MVPNMSSLMSHLHKFAAVGSLSYVDLSRKEVQNGSSLHKSTHLSFHLRRLNLVWASWEGNSTAHPFSTRFCTIFWIMALLSLVPAFVHCWKFLPVPSPTMSRNFNMHPDIVIMPVWLVHHGSLFATLNSSTTDDRGSWSCSDLFQKPTAVKLGGSLNLFHFPDQNSPRFLWVKLRFGPCCYVAQKS